MMSFVRQKVVTVLLIVRIQEPTKTGTYERDYAGLSNVKFTVTCCDTDFCNVESQVEINVDSSITTLNRTSLSCLFYMSFFYYLYFVTL